MCVTAPVRARVRVYSGPVCVLALAEVLEIVRELSDSFSIRS